MGKIVPIGSNLEKKVETSNSSRKSLCSNAKSSKRKACCDTFLPVLIVLAFRHSLLLFPFSISRPSSLQRLSIHSPSSPSFLFSKLASQPPIAYKKTFLLFSPTSSCRLRSHACEHLCPSIIRSHQSWLLPTRKALFQHTTCLCSTMGHQTFQVHINTSTCRLHQNLHTN